MRNLLLLLSVVFIYLFPTVSLAQTAKSVSKDDALAIAQKQFVDKDVDYYILSNNTSAVWKIFVDAEPMKGWQHDCYVLTIPKTTTTDINTIMPRKVLMKVPPKEDYAPLLVKNRYGSNANSKPQVRKAASSNGKNEVARRTYAIILSGGMNKNSNYERYWNDCSFIYQTLVNKYSIPKENIYPIMSDGKNPAADMRSISGDYKSQSLDLDNDGVDEIKLAATKANVMNTLGTLANKLNEDDHLFIFVIDHGGTDDNNTNSYICLWNYERLYDYELATMLEPFTSKFVNVNVVLGQCFSGGFNDNLKKVGCVVAAASKGSEASWACPDIPYDEFVYQWTCAVNEANAFGVPITSDCDNNHRVTMEEAFDYAYKEDRHSTKENPQYQSNPKSIGEDLAFNNLPKAVDLYIRDSEEDTGKEPNTVTKEFWKSPDIWVRNKRDNIKEHQNPEYSENHPACFVYVRIYNRGKKDFKGGGQWIHVYWAKASTGITIKAWKGKEVYQNHVTGEHLRAAPIPKITAGGYADVIVTWGLPDDMIYSPADNGTEKHHFCLVAKIMDTFEDDSYNPQITHFDVQGSNDIAQKNVSIVSRREISKGINVFVRNIYKNNHKYSLELITHTEKDKYLFSKANVKMTMARPIYKAWKLGGLRATDIGYSPAVNPYCVSLKSENSKLENICMNGSEFEKVTMNLEFKTPATYFDESYTFDLIQKDEQGNIVGGETFVVEAPIYSYKPIDIIPIKIGEGKYQLSVDLQGIDYLVHWTDKNGEDIGEGNKVTVTPTLKNKEFSVTAISSQGEMVQKSITLESKIGIKSVLPSLVDDFIYVVLHSPVDSKNAVIQVRKLSLGGAIRLSKSLPIGTKEIRLDATSLSSGIYILYYSVDGQIIDSHKFNKK